MRAFFLYIITPALLGAAVLYLLATLFPACALAPWLGRYAPDGCPAALPSAQSRALAFETERRIRLEAELDQLQRQLAALDNCEAEPLIKNEHPPEDAPPEEKPQEEKADEPAPTPENRDERAENAESEEGVDEERWDEKDISLLEGCWKLESDYALRSQQSDEKLTVPLWRACFDAAGNGTQEFELSNGLKCAGSLTAGFRADGNMTLDDGAPVPCDNGAMIVRRRGVCRLDAEKRAQCGMRDRAGESQVTLRRDR